MKWKSRKKYNSVREKQEEMATSLQLQLSPVLLKKLEKLLNITG